MGRSEKHNHTNLDMCTSSFYKITYNNKGKNELKKGL